jgi:hypothetical protein
MELNDNLSAFWRQESGVRSGFGLWETATDASGRIIRGKTSLTNSGDPDIPCFLLLDDPATSYFYLLDWAPIAVTSSEQLHKEPFARLPTALRPHRPVQNWFFVRQKRD